MIHAAAVGLGPTPAGGPRRVVSSFSKESLTEIVKRLKAIDIEDAEIIVIDHASNGGTREVLEAEIKPLVNKIIYHEKTKEKEQLYVPDSRKPKET